MHNISRFTTTTTIIGVIHFAFQMGLTDRHVAYQMYYIIYHQICITVLCEMCRAGPSQNTSDLDVMVNSIIFISSAPMVPFRNEPSAALRLTPYLHERLAMKMIGQT
jgi:hypothetical protein